MVVRCAVWGPVARDILVQRHVHLSNWNLCQNVRSYTSKTDDVTSSAGAGWNLPYERGLFGLELMFVLLFAIVEFPRLQLGSSGNKAEKLMHIVFMIAMSTAVLLYFTYYTSLQTFVCDTGKWDAA